MRQRNSQDWHLNILGLPTSVSSLVSLFLSEIPRSPLSPSECGVLAEFFRVAGLFVMPLPQSGSQSGSFAGSSVYSPIRYPCLLVLLYSLGTSFVSGVVSICSPRSTLTLFVVTESQRTPSDTTAAAEKDRLGSFCT